MQEILENINQTLLNIEKKIDNLENRLEKIEENYNKINKQLNEEVLNECKKMGSHIDFVENVYENVKHPLGYITNKINNVIKGSNEEKKYELTYKKI